MISRRQFLQAGAVAGASLLLPSSLTAAANPRRILKDSNLKGMISVENPRYRNLRITFYAGKMRPDLYLKHLEERREDIPNGNIKPYLRDLELPPNSRFFLSMPGEPFFRLFFEEFIEPTETELRDYGGFINFFSRYDRNLGLINLVYEKFQEKAYRDELASKKDSPLIHPAVLFSGRFGEGLCADKALALHDIYERLGFENVIPYGLTPDGKLGHMWCRMYTQEGSHIDMDPNYKKFTLVRRENPA